MNIQTEAGNLASRTRNGGTTVKLPLFQRPHPTLTLLHASLPLQTHCLWITLRAPLMLEL